MTAAAPSTPLQPVPARSDNVIWGFLQNDGPVGLSLFADQILRNPDGRVAIELALDMIERGAVGDRAVRHLIRVTHPEDTGPLAFDALLLAERLWPEHGAALEEEGDVPLIAHAAHGLHTFSTADWGSRGITSAGQLEAYAAVTKFVICSTSARLVSSGMAAGVFWRKITNPRLSALLQERPADAERIIAYAADRGIGPTSHKDVQRLRAWLDEDAPAGLAVGWL